MPAHSTLLRRTTSAAVALAFAATGLTLASTPAMAAGEITANHVAAEPSHDAETGVGSVSYTLTLTNGSESVQNMSVADELSFPAGVDVTKVSANGDLYNETMPVTQLEPDPNADDVYHIVDDVPINPGAVYTYTVQIDYAYSMTSPPTMLSCVADGGFRVNANVAVAPYDQGEPDITTACVDAPTPAEPATSEPEPPTVPAAPANNAPEGAMSAWAGEGVISFAGWAFDRDDFSKPVTAVIFVDGKIATAQAANARSVALDPYGLPMKGFWGSVPAPSSGQHEVCLFLYDVSGSGGVLTACQNVSVASQDPRGDVIVEVKGSAIVINGWLLDDSNSQASLGTWLVDNGNLFAAFVTSAPSPYLHPYGVYGNHAFGTVYYPKTSGTHNICVYGLNIGFGQNAWIECVQVTVDVTVDDPQGEVYIYAEDIEGNGLTDIWVDMYAWDPNASTQSLQVVFFVDGQPYWSDYANMESPYLYPYGVYGHHGLSIWLGEAGWEFNYGQHEVCVFVYNAGPGNNKLMKCQNVWL